MRALFTRSNFVFLAVAIGLAASPALSPAQGQGESATPPRAISGALSNQQLSQLNAQAKALTEELLQVNIQLANIDQLLSRFDRGDFLVFLSGFRLAMSEAELRDLIERTPHSSADFNNPFVLNAMDPTLVINTYRGVSRTNADQLMSERAPLFRRRAELITRLDQIRRIVMADADRPRSAYDPNRDYTPKQACALPHSWRFDVQGLGSSTWSVDTSGRASESGMGNARGTASLSGGGLSIDWVAGAYAGTYRATLDGDCSGKGTLQQTRTPMGPRSFPFTATSLGGGN